MTVLSTILLELEMNPHLIIADLNQNPPAVTATGYSNLHQEHFIDICVAPKGGLYLPDQLNGFMESLVSLLPVHKLEFFLIRDSKPYAGGDGKKFNFMEHFYRLHLGYLCFKEKIGQKRISGKTVRLIASQEAEAGDLLQMINEVMPPEILGIDSNIYRAILIHVYPNQKIAEAKYDRNDFGRQMTILHLEHYVPDIKAVYMSFEKYFQTMKRT